MCRKVLLVSEWQLTSWIKVNTDYVIVEFSVDRQIVDIAQACPLLSTDCYCIVLWFDLQVTAWSAPDTTRAVGVS